MKLETLKFVKNIDDSDRWAYSDWQHGSQQQLHWANAKGDITNADKADLGDLILLVQKFLPDSPETLVTHLVKVISTSAETLGDEDWGIVREVEVIWVADFTHLASIPTDKDVFGWKRRRPQGTKIVQLENLKDNRVSQLWHSIEIFQRHVTSMLGLTED
ncbi:MAG: hypothetical protein NT070_09600 [Cyanobacteria bacterium]|nr:hypothetical protein [Cyanobacteriota bacterium]